MISKSILLNELKSLPDEFEAADLIEKVIFIKKVKKGLKQSDEGLVYSNNEAKKRLSKWIR